MSSELRIARFSYVDREDLIDVSVKSNTLIRGCISHETRPVRQRLECVMQ